MRSKIIGYQYLADRRCQRGDCDSVVLQHGVRSHDFLGSEIDDAFILHVAEFQAMNLILFQDTDLFFQIRRNLVSEGGQNKLAHVVTLQVIFGMQALPLRAGMNDYRAAMYMRFP
jgi:hypothetical protein